LLLLKKLRPIAHNQDIKRACGSKRELPTLRISQHALLILRLLSKTVNKLLLTTRPKMWLMLLLKLKPSLLLLKKLRPIAHNQDIKRACGSKRELPTLRISQHALLILRPLLLMANKLLLTSSPETWLLLLLKLKQLLEPLLKPRPIALPLKSLWNNNHKLVACLNALLILRVSSLMANKLLLTIRPETILLLLLKLK